MFAHRSMDSNALSILVAGTMHRTEGGPKQPDSHGYADCGHAAGEGVGRSRGNLCPEHKESIQHPPLHHRSPRLKQESKCLNIGSGAMEAAATAAAVG